MDIKDLTEQQQQAFLDLAMLAMYADGHLTTVEDERVRRLLGTMGCTSDYDCNKQYDASVSRVSRHSQTREASCIHAATLAKSFTTHEQRRRVLEIMAELIASDSHITLQEGNLLSVVREALQL